MKIGLIRCAELPEPDHDEAPLLDAFRAAGAEAATLAWDDPADRADRFDLCVLRATWNYHVDHEAFSAWLRRTARVTRLWNPTALVEWNMDKRYLLELEERGVPVLPTVVVERGSTPDLGHLCAEQGWDEIVVKPAISCGSWRTRRFDRAALAEGQAFLDGLAAERDVLVQRYLPVFETHGERNLIWIDGQLTHAIQKEPRFADDDESVTLVPMGADERAFAERVVAPYADQLLYARVDVVPDDGGRPLLSELELIEPSLFFPLYPPALERFVAATLARARESVRK